MIAQHNNSHCNLMQVALTFFMSAKKTPAAVRSVLAHAGLAVSEATLRRMLESARAEQKKVLQREGLTWRASLTWDNLDFSLPVATSTQANQPKFESITTGLVFQLEHGVTIEDLRRPHVSPLPGNYPEYRTSNRWSTPPATRDHIRPSLAVRRRVTEAMIWVIQKILVDECATHFKTDLKTIPSHLHIPIKKTACQPVFAIDEKCSTNDGNIKVLRSWMEQTGITSETTRNVVTIVHGDLGVLERVKSIMESRSIERTDYESFDYLETVPGLFHVLMACADAMWRTYVEPKDLQDDPHGVFHQLAKLNPSHIAKLKSHAPFRMLHDGIDRILTARILECARSSLKLASVDQVKTTTYTWDKIEKLASDIYADHVEGGSHSQAGDDDGFDSLTEAKQAQKNRRLFNRDALLYRVLALSMRYGAVGTVEDVLCYWVPIFKATRKHKYATHMFEFLTRLQGFPPRLARAIRMNWLCNPGGRADGFRAIDWMVELNNLYIKVSHIFSVKMALTISTVRILRKWTQPHNEPHY